METSGEMHTRICAYVLTMKTAILCIESHKPTVIGRISAHALLACSRHIINIWRARSVFYMQISLLFMYLETSSIFIDEYISLIISR